jgi:hypothetical protein
MGHDFRIGAFAHQQALACRGQSSNDRSSHTQARARRMAVGLLMMCRRPMDRSPTKRSAGESTGRIVTATTPNTSPEIHTLVARRPISACVAIRSGNKRSSRNRPRATPVTITSQYEMRTIPLLSACSYPHESISRRPLTALDWSEALRTGRLPPGPVRGLWRRPVPNRATPTMAAIPAPAKASQPRCVVAQSCGLLW